MDMPFSILVSHGVPGADVAMKDLGNIVELLVY
jgi:hypothetical protein